MSDKKKEEAKAEPKSKPVKVETGLKKSEGDPGIRVATPGPNEVRVVSRVNHTLTIAYGGDALYVPPRGRTKPLNKEHLGAIPKGAILIKA